MKRPIELQAIGVDRQITSAKLWGWRILSLLFLANASLSVTGGTVALAGTILGAGGVLVAVLYALAEEHPEETESAQEPSAA